MLSKLSKNKTAFALATALAVASPLAFNDVALADSATATAQQASASTTAQNQRSYNFPQWDDSKESRRFVEAGAAAASHEGIAIVVWGGTTELKRQAWEGAADLFNDPELKGTRVSFIIGPDIYPMGDDGQPIAAMYEIYANSLPVFKPSHVGSQMAHTMRQGVYEVGKAAYEKSFPNLVSMRAPESR